MVDPSLSPSSDEDDVQKSTEDIPGSCGTKCLNVNWAINRHTCPDCGAGIHPICCQEFGKTIGEKVYQCIPCYEDESKPAARESTDPPSTCAPGPAESMFDKLPKDLLLKYMKAVKADKAKDKKPF